MKYEDIPFTDYTVYDGTEMQLGPYKIKYFLHDSGVMNVNTTINGELIYVQICWFDRLYKYGSDDRAQYFGGSFAVLKNSYNMGKGGYTKQEFGYRFDINGNEIKYYNAYCPEEARDWWTENFSNREGTEEYINFIRCLINYYKHILSDKFPILKTA